VADLTEGPRGGSCLHPILGKERRSDGKKAGRARKTKLPLKQDLPFL